MATSKSKVNTRKNRVRPAHRSKAAPPERQEPIDRLRGRESSPTTLEEAIEQERGRLNRATSLLACLKYALQYAEEFEDDVDRPSLADVAAFATSWSRTRSTVSTPSTLAICRTASRCCWGSGADEALAGARNRSARLHPAVAPATEGCRWLSRWCGRWSFSRALRRRCFCQKNNT